MKLRKILMIAIIAVFFVLGGIAVASCGLGHTKNSDNYPFSIEITSSFDKVVYPGAIFKELLNF